MAKRYSLFSLGYSTLIHLVRHNIDKLEMERGADDDDDLMIDDPCPEI